MDKLIFISIKQAECPTSTMYRQYMFCMPWLLRLFAANLSALGSLSSTKICGL